MDEIVINGDVQSPENQELIREILSGPDYFTCEKGHGRLKKTKCLKRQSKGIRYGDTSRREIPPECFNCEQGQTIKKELEPMIKEKQKICNEPDCKGDVVARGKCRKHYDKWRSVTKPEDRIKQRLLCNIKQRPLCDEPGCGEDAKVRGKCKLHYDRWYRRQKKSKRQNAAAAPLHTPEVQSPNIQTLTVDFTDFPELFEDLKEEAARDFRTLGLQALYLIKKGLTGESR